MRLNKDQYNQMMFVHIGKMGILLHFRSIHSLIAPLYTQSSTTI